MGDAVLTACAEHGGVGMASVHKSVAAHDTEVGEGGKGGHVKWSPPQDGGLPREEIDDAIAIGCYAGGGERPGGGTAVSFKVSDKRSVSEPTPKPYTLYPIPYTLYPIPYTLKLAGPVSFLCTLIPHIAQVCFYFGNRAGQHHRLSVWAWRGE